MHIKYYSKLSLASLGDYAPANEGTFSPLTDNEFPVIYKIQDVSWKRPLLKERKDIKLIYHILNGSSKNLEETTFKDIYL